MKANRYRIAIIVFLAVMTTVLHYTTDPHDGSIHDVLQRVYYIPIILAGLWYGWRGGLLTAILITVAYFPHARHGWHAPYSFLFRLNEMVMFHVIGLLCGILSTREKRAFEAERRAREDKEKALEDLQQRTSELFTVEEQLRRADRLAALGTLSAGLAHEIRNPLGSIKTSAEMLRDSGSPDSSNNAEDTPDFVGIILEEADRLDGILRNFLEFARQERQQPEDQAAICRASEALTRTVELLRPHTEKRHINVKLSVAPNESEVAIPSTRLQQVILNLLLNAVDAVGENGSIEAHIEERDDTVRLIVEDSGPGLTAEIADRAFDPFVTTKERGTGLGLSIVDRILSSHGAGIELDREHYPLNRFVISLPKTTY